LSQAFKDPIEVRAVIHMMLGKMVRQAGCTTLLIAEKKRGEERIGMGIEEFVADGVILLTLSLRRGHLERRLQIIKIRGTDTSKHRLRYSISGKGIRLYAEPKISAVEKVYAERISSGIEGLDEMLTGGVLKGSVTLVAGASGTGKTTSALQFIAEGARRGQRGLFVSSEEGVQQLIQYGEGFGWNLRKSVDDGIVTMISVYPELYNFEEILLALRTLLREHKPERFVIDSLAPLERAMPQSEYIEHLKSMISLLKAQGVTTLLTSVSESTAPVTGTGISTLMDNIISLRDVELESALRRSMIIFKARGTAHDRGIREFEITSSGMVVRGKFAGVEQILGGAARRSFTEEAASAWASAFAKKR
jgi:circadian clock protein KaiC